MKPAASMVVLASSCRGDADVVRPTVKQLDEFLAPLGFRFELRGAGDDESELTPPSEAAAAIVFVSKEYLQSDGPATLSAYLGDDIRPIFMVYVRLSDPSVAAWMLAELADTMCALARRDPSQAFRSGYALPEQADTIVEDLGNEIIQAVMPRP